MRLQRIVIGLGMGLLATVTVATVLNLPANAAFNFFGRELGQTYFEGKTGADSSYYVFAWSPDLQYEGFQPVEDTSPLTKDKFINEYRKRLFSTTDYNRGHAAATILMMLDYNGNSADFNDPSLKRWEKGVQIAQSRFGEWSRLISDYDTAGRVNWNTTFPGNKEFDWLGVASKDEKGVYYPDPDVWAVQLLGPNDSNQIYEGAIFYDEDGQPSLKVQKKCANFTGSAQPLTPVEPPAPTTYQLVPSLAPLNPSAIAPGGLSTVTPGFTRSGSSNAGNFNLRVNVTEGADLFDWVNTSGGGIFGSKGLTWNYPSFSGGSDTKSPVIRAKPGLTTGRACFTVSIDRSNPAGEPAGPTIEQCVTITPVGTTVHSGVQAKGSDFHAGGNTCDIVGGKNGSINTGSSSSYSQYLISASGLIAPNVGSYGDATDQKGKLGHSGGYLSVCRPNLYFAATTGSIAAGAKVVPSGSYTMDQLYALDNGSHIIAAPELTITGGQVGGAAHKYPLTVFVANTLTVAGNTTLANSTYNRTGQASLGIIADDIRILPAATRVDAFLFARDVIDTCYTGAPTNFNGCKNKLTVNGFLMAEHLSLRRLGTAAGATNFAVGEEVVMNGQLYLNPPKLFASQVEQGLNVTQFENERPVRR